MKNQTIFLVSVGSIFLCGIALLFFISSKNSAPTGGQGSSNVSVFDGKQYIDILAKGGYAPRTTVAKAGMETVLRVKTQGTFDCSSSLTIPKLNYQKNLAPSASEEILVKANDAVGTLQGVCSMGMYSFKVVFN
jgi:plastocyanin domain-containing protein